ALGTNWGQHWIHAGVTSRVSPRRIRRGRAAAMASLEQRGNRYRIIFRLGGRKHHVSIKAADRKDAEACLVRLEENLGLAERLHQSLGYRTPAVYGGGSAGQVFRPEALPPAEGLRGGKPSKTERPRGADTPRKVAMEGVILVQTMGSTSRVTSLTLLLCG